MYKNNFKIIVLLSIAFIVLYNMLLNTYTISYAEWYEAGEGECTPEQLRQGCIDLHIPWYDPANPGNPTTGFLKEGGGGTPSDTIFVLLIKYIYKIAAYVAGTILTIYIIIAGIQMIVSKNASSFIDAKEKLISAIEGIIVLVLAGYILYLINPSFFSL